MRQRGVLSVTFSQGPNGRGKYWKATQVSCARIFWAPSRVPQVRLNPRYEASCIENGG